MALGQPVDAEASFRQAISLNSEAPGAYVRLLKSLVDQRVLVHAPDSQRNHMHAAIALIRLGRSDEAREHLARSGDVIQQPKARKALIASYLDSGHNEEARRLM
jgi:tetratricopeptide (TPR) repeat protein